MNLIIAAVVSMTLFAPMSDPICDHEHHHAHHHPSPCLNAAYAKLHRDVCPTP